MNMMVGVMILKFGLKKAMTAIAAIGLAGFAGSVYAQENLFPEEFSGERTEPLGNYWDGVDDAGFLRVYVASSPVLNNVGRMVNTPPILHAELC